MATAIEKQQFRNDDLGYIGAVVITARGEERGIAVEPGATVWLSEQEQILTANAPRSPKDNPFIAQPRDRFNSETGEVETVMVTPLVPVSENRYVPAGERFVPGLSSEARAVAEAQRSATGEEPEVVVTDDASVAARHEEVAELGEEAAPGIPAPSRAARAAEAARSQEEVAVPPEEAPEAPETPQPPAAPPEAPAQSPEELAAKVDQTIGEETGAAPQPTVPAPEGEFAASEEVGTPVGPERGEETGGQPAPFVPPKE